MLGLTITCICGKSEFFEGDLLESVDASSKSGRWFTDRKGFMRCGGPQCTAEPSEPRPLRPMGQLPLFE